MAVKSRLSVGPLAPAYREMIDAYFAILSPASGVGGEVRAAYEALYDAPSQGVSFAAAAAIEESSWATTKLLVVEEESIEVFEPIYKNNEKSWQYNAADVKTEENTGETPADDTPALSLPARRYLALLLAGDFAGVHRAASELGRLEDELVDEINELAMTLLGDVALEAAGEGYAVIEDYLDEVRQWTK